MKVFLILFFSIGWIRNNIYPRLVVEKPGHGIRYITRGVRNSSDIHKSLLLLKIASMAPGLQKLHRLPVLCSCGFILQLFGKNPFSSVALGTQEWALDAVFFCRLAFKSDHWMAIYSTWTADRDLEDGLPQGIPWISHSMSPSLDELPWSLALNENNN